MQHHNSASCEDQVKENEVGGAYGTQPKENSSQSFSGENPKKRDHSEDRGVDGRMGSEWILGRLAVGV
jgi:hypothetical protein